MHSFFFFFFIGVITISVILYTPKRFSEKKKKKNPSTIIYEKTEYLGKPRKSINISQKPYESRKKKLKFCIMQF